MALEPEVTSTTAIKTTETSTSTSSAAETSTTSVAPVPTSTLGFCLKAATPGKPNYGNHAAFAGANVPLILARPTHPTYLKTTRLNLDLTTGAITLNNTNAAGFHLYTPPLGNNDARRAIRSAHSLITADGLFCTNPGGNYTSGSILQCHSDAQ